MSGAPLRPEASCDVFGPNEGWTVTTVSMISLASGPALPVFGGAAQVKAAALVLEPGADGNGPAGQPGARDRAARAVVRGDVATGFPAKPSGGAANAGLAVVAQPERTKHDVNRLGLQGR